MFKYLKFTLVHLWVLGGTIGLFMGGEWLWLGLAVTLTLFVLGDALAGKDMSVPEYKHAWLFNLLLYSTLPSLLLLLVAVAWAFGSVDPLGIAPLVESYTGYDMILGREQTTMLDYVGAVFNVAILIVLAGTNVGHELTHRTWDPLSMVIGRWLLAASWDAQFSIEHVYGHHVNIATRKDPATASRGENVYGFMIRSTIGQIGSAWHLETSRLKKCGHGVWTWRNRILRGHLMSVSLAVGAYMIGGWSGLLGFLICALGGKAGLEVINYIEHYGLCRVPGEPVQPHHSWNSNAKMSGYTLFNLTRHSDHHANGDKPFWKLLPYPDAPMMPYGYITMLLIALVPPVWKRMTISLLQNWDRVYASPDEQILTNQQNRESGIDVLVGSTT
jgi:Fatty acid desaturase